MKTVEISSLRSSLGSVCRSVYRKKVDVAATFMGSPVILLLHPERTPETRELACVGIAEARVDLTDLWEGVNATGEHVVITSHGKPRAVMVPYVEPTAA